MNRSALIEQVSEFLTRRRLASFLITAGGILFVAASGPSLAPDDARVGVLTWIALGLMALAIVQAVALPRRVAPEARFSVAWSFGVLPFVYGFLATMLGSPIALMWLGVLVSLVLLGGIALSVARGNR